MLKKSVVVVLGLMISSLVYADEKLGVPVYAGAKFEPAATEFAVAMVSGDAYCYSTPDGLDKVVSFYKRKGLKFVSGDPKQAKLTKGKVEVYVQNPWADVKAQKINQTTLTSISKPE